MLHIHIVQGTERVGEKVDVHASLHRVLVRSTSLEVYFDGC
jgi:hypothetical protein